MDHDAWAFCPAGVARALATVAWRTLAKSKGGSGSFLATRRHLPSPAFAASRPMGCAVTVSAQPRTIRNSVRSRRQTLGEQSRLVQVPQERLPARPSTPASALAVGGTFVCHH